MENNLEEIVALLNFASNRLRELSIKDAELMEKLRAEQVKLVNVAVAIDDIRSWIPYKEAK